MTKILVIEDNPAILKEVLDWLRFEGFNAVGAMNGRQGVELALEHMPDLILSDVMMPEMNGHRVLLELRTHPATALVPFIFLTAKVSRDDIRYAMELGADDYIPKPFTREELLGAVVSRLQKADMQRQYATHEMKELRTTLAQTLPHELRTPLVSILGYGELLSMDADTLSPERISEMAQMIVKGGQRLYALIKNYMFYAQLEIDAVNPEKVAAYHTRHIDSAIPLVASTGLQVAQDHERNNDLVLELSDDAPVCISEADLVKIIQEVVDNAFKFSEAYSPVHVATSLEYDRFRIHVSDQGRGMKPDNIRQIGAYTQFEREIYEQQGAGLGLTIAKQLTELYRGQMDIRSTPGQGTTVVIELLTPQD